MSHKRKKSFDYNKSKKIKLETHNEPTSKNIIGMTTVDEETRQLVETACETLGSLFTLGGGDITQVTHLICGSNKRTLKTLFAIAKGAFLLEPQWVRDSLKHGFWVSNFV
jgi:hypothetical protein